jgi:hypothetical protein
MGKRTVTKWWTAGAVTLAVAAVLIIADGLALAAHFDAMTPGTRVGLMPDNFSRSIVILIGLGIVIAGAGLLAELVAWFGALANTRLLADKRWFNRLLWAGIVGIATLPLFGLGAMIAGSAMIAYLVGAPDTSVGRTQEAEAAPRTTIWSKPRIVRWSTWGLVPMAAVAVVSLLIANQTNRGGLLEGHTWTALMLLTTCIVVIVCAVITESVAWWAAIFNARELADQTWFKLLVWSGIVAAATMPLLGLGALIAAGVGIVYRTSAPDATASEKPAQAIRAAIV